MNLTEAQIKQYQEDGFLVVENMLTDEEADRAAARVERIFDGEYNTGVQPDGMNFGKDSNVEVHSKNIDNAWRCDYYLGSLALQEKIGRCLAQLNQMSGARMLQDITIWKQPGAQCVYYHQDGSYATGVVPGGDNVHSCALALTDTYPDVGTIEYVRGSHKWGLAEPRALGADIYGSDDYRKPVRAYAESLGITITPDMIVQATAPKGGGGVSSLHDLARLRPQHQC